MYPKLKLLPGKDKALLRKHPWIFSGAFKELPTNIEEGTLVQVCSHKEKELALGFFLGGRIAVKVLSYQQFDDAKAIIQSHVLNALNYRKSLGYFNREHTNIYRLIYGEGDLMPGLVVDRYANAIVLQPHHAGWDPFLPAIAEQIKNELQIDTAYVKPPSKHKENLPGYYLFGEAKNTTAIEYNCSYNIDWETGQKTGFFIDQRENRDLLGKYSKGKKVLNTFSYSGGFSISALKQGATFCTSVDISAPAVELANENATLNKVAKNHEGVAADVFEFLKSNGADYDIIVLDPPAFAKNRRAQHQAVQGYKRLNKLAMQKIKSGGLIFTFSCSQHITPQLFKDTLYSAAIESGRSIRFVQKLVQPADHPVNLFHPEGEYLKGWVLYVE